ncbi:MAG: hypothetical protein ACLPKB_22850 [Xanthobacteraceae bacterium]
MDIIAVQRDELGLLQLVASDVTDRTPQIVQSLVQTAENLAIAAGRNAQLDTASVSESAEFEFDPFDVGELKRINAGLRRFGFCVFVAGYSFPESQCGDRRHEAPAGPQSLVFKTLPVRSEAALAGILYRPSLTYKLVILRKADPNGRGPWTLHMHRSIEMPNISPVLSIGVERAMFTQRTTKLSFDHGVLTDVAIHKDSELVGFVNIPLAVAQAVVDVPAQIVQIRINDVDQQAQLIQTQSQLLDALNSYRATLANAGTVGGQPRSATRGASLGDCTDSGGSPTDCLRLYGVVR